MASWGLIGRALVDNEPPHQGSLFGYGSYRANIHVVTLKAIDVKVTVRGFAARIDASLTYHNATDKALELEYSMPVDEGAAVYKFEAVINGRKITAQCMEKKKAEKIYKDAVKSGHTAVLGREDDLTADVFHIALGNLPAGTNAELQLSMMMELKVKTDGAVSFTLPTILNPRYCPSDVTPDQHTASVAQMDRPETVIVSKVYTFGIAAKVQGGHTIARITSHRDFLNVSLSDDNMSAEVSQDSGSFKPDHDWNMLIYYANPYKTHIIRETGDRSATTLMKDDLIMINMHPELPDQSYSNRNEIIFVVDRSGSMDGEKIQSASATLLLFLKSLPIGCYFNVISFGSSYSLLFNEGSKEYTEETLQRALELQSTMAADMGGTEILQPLRQIYSKPPIPGFARQILLLTDGQVFNVDQVNELVRSHAHETRAFAVGIGDGASTALVKGLARAGRGYAEMVYQQDKVQLKVMGMVKSMLQECARDVKINCDVDPPGGIKLIPKDLPLIFGGQHLIVYVRLPQSTEVRSITVSGVVGNDDFKKCIHGSDIVTVHDEERTLHRLAARAQINEWQINNEEDITEDMIALSLATGVVCRRTALVGVDQDMKPVGQTNCQEAQSSVLVGGGPLSAGGMPRQQLCSMMFGGPLYAPQGGVPPPPPPSSGGFSFGVSSESLRRKRLCKKKNYGAPPRNMRSCSSYSEGFSFGSSSQPLSAVEYETCENVDSVAVEEDDSSDDEVSCDLFDVDLPSYSSNYMAEANDTSNTQSKVDYENNLMAIVSLQKFDGSWTVEDAMKITSLSHTLLTSTFSCKNESSWATAVILAFLEVKYSTEIDEWVLLANKARMFITRCGDDVEALLVSARKVLAAH